MLCYFLYWLIQFPLMFVSPQKIRWLFVAKGMVPLNPPAYGPDCDVLAGHIQYDKKAIPINLPLLFVITEDVADDVNMHREKVDFPSYSESASN